jgi:hypothetical protein
MPKVIKPNDPEVEAALAEWAQFENRTNWHSTHKGNLTRQWDGSTLTVFMKRNRRFAWSSNYEDEVRYSANTFETVEEAIESLGWELCVGR